MRSGSGYFSLVSLLLISLLISGCTALGYSTGSAIDRAAGDKEIVTDGESLQVGDELFLYWKDRPTSVGTVVGIQSPDSVLIEHYSGSNKIESSLASLISGGELDRIEKTNAKKTYRSVFGVFGLAIDLSIVITVIILISRIPSQWEP